MRASGMWCSERSCEHDRGLMNVITPKPHGAHEESDATLEKVALAGTAAIQQLIADRDQLRKRANDQQRELVTLSAINEELCPRIALIRHHYVELGTRILAQLDSAKRGQSTFPI